MEQYEILEQIGKGAFGSAVLVRHKHEKKKYVLKKIRLARQTDRTRRSAHQEMELISKMRNPFIVEYKDSWVEKGCYVCIIIGYCEGGDMAETIKKANGALFSEEKLCKWLVQLLMALDYLHVNHILHRDVKCSNIFLTKDRDIRLGDFGLAKMLTSDDLASSVVGTPSYMCPELLADIPYGSKSDIWSLGCCIYEMTSHKPAFKAFGVTVGEGCWWCFKLPVERVVVYWNLGLGPEVHVPDLSVGSSRDESQVDSEVPEVLALATRHLAAELLRHPHLQPYVLKVNLKLNSPRCNSLSTHWPETEFIKKTRFADPEDVPVSVYKEKRFSFSNDRTLNPSISGAEHDSPSQRIRSTPNYFNQRIAELSVGSTHEDSAFKQKSCFKSFKCCQNSKVDSSKSFHHPKEASRACKEPTRQIFVSFFLNQLNLLHSHHFPTSRAPSRKSVHSDRRASFPMPTRAASHGSPWKPNIDPFIPTRRTSSTSAQGSSTSPQGDRSIMKDKCTVQVRDRNFGRLSFADAWQGVEGAIQLEREGGSDCSDQNATAGASSRTSSDLRRRRFDTSSYQQRAEALEGLLEFSSRLLQEEKYDELGVLLKPFGPGKVSPRETAIWLTKSIKENTIKQDGQCPC
ncbi:NIMA-related serine/threonine kinase 1 [Actinidia rufa]|uniref:non-specific serine/threonine protein kinase n=1 Tax=Actinidia rufa TaxID=165716 RepID=A0A7J0EWB5_9ERIC|nr:NIMA-related serine/threonine kinase 1 [Actinidia rufa]